MTRKRKSRSVQATEEGLRILKESKAASRDSEGRRLTFERIAEKADVDPKTVKTFLYGGRVDPESACAIAEKGFSLKVTDIVGQEAWNEVCSKPKPQKLENIENLENTVLITPQTIAKHYSNIPQSGAVEFVGRAKQLSELHQLLEQNNEVVIAAIAGMGGIGKTELAIQYAQNHVETYKGGICWLYPKRGDIGGQIVEFAITHFSNFSLPKELTLAGQVKFCWQHWAEGQVLVVIDDVLDYRQIRPYLPSESRFKVLITTRERLSKPLIRLDLNVLKPRAALNLLKSLIGRERLKLEPWVARKLCNWLGYLPLGLELVGHHLLQDEDLSLTETLQRLERKRLRHPALENPEPTMTAQLGVIDAFELSWERLHENTQRLGCFLSLFALAPIPWNSKEFQITVSEKDVIEIKDALQAQGITQEIWEALENSIEATEEAKNKLVRLNLLQPCGEGSYRFHQLIREFFREKLEALPEAEELKYYFVAYFAGITKQIQTITHNYILILSPLIPHLEEIIEKMTNYLTNSDFGYPFNTVIYFYENQGLYLLAENWCHKFSAKVKDRFPKNRLWIASIQKRIAMLIRLQGRYAESEKLYNNILDNLKVLVAGEHYLVISTQHELALLYILQDHFDEAEILLKTCLEAKQRSEDAFTLDTSIDDIFELYQNLPSPSKLENKNFRTSSIKDNLQSNEPNLLVSIINALGAIYGERGQYDQAEPLLKKSLELTQNLLGDNNLSVAAYQNNLASLYKLQGKYKEAESLSLKCLNIINGWFGENHPSVAEILSQIGDIYRLQGHLKKAESAFKRALEIRKSVLNQNHPDYASSLNNLGLVYTEMEQYKRAESFLLKALEIRETSLGNKHLDYAVTLNNLAILYYYQELITKAEPMYLESLHIRKEILGEDHPEIASSLHNLADLYSLAGRYDQADKLWKKAFEIALKTLGKNHPDTLLYQKSRVMLASKQSELKKNYRKRQSQGFGRQAPKTRDILKSSVFSNYLAPVAQKIFQHLWENITKQALEGYKNFCKGIVLLEVQDSYDEIGMSYVTQNDCLKASQNAPNSIWDSVLMYLDMYNPEDYFIVLIVDPLEKPGTQVCYSYMLPF